MLIAAVYNNFKLYGTDTFELNLNWKDGEEQLFDLTGYHARLRLFISKTDRTLVHEIDDTNGITLGDGTAEPNITCHIPDEDVVLFPSGPTYLTLEVEEPDGDWQRLLEGKVKYEA